MDEFLSGPGWQASSEPYLTIRVPVTDLWPVGALAESGGATDKDDLDNEAGQHPILAIGARANRPNNLCGVVVTVHNGFAVLNVAPAAMVKAYVANITAHPATYAAAFAIGAPVYLDDSAALSAGVTLSLAAANDAAANNPFVGYLFYDQDEYVDAAVGGANAAAVWPKAANNAALVEAELTVMLWPGNALTA